MVRVGSLFSGIGGIDLGLERAGLDIAWQAENDEFCSSVLRLHWPDVPNLGPVEGIDWSVVPRVEVLAGGFPCQDVSIAGRRDGVEGKSSGLWAEYARAIRELRPRIVLVENVVGLLSRGIDRVLADLADVGYDAEWDCIPAAAAGAPQLRTRLWILAYPRGDGGAEDEAIRPGWNPAECRAPWPPQPEVCRVVDGLPARLVRPELRALGNAVVPQQAELLGRIIVEWLNRRDQDGISDGRTDVR